MKEFRATMERLQKHVRDKKLDRTLGIELKDPLSYTMKDVLSIAQKIQERHSDVEKVGGCMGRIRKFFRGVGQNAPTLKSFWAFVPNDSYGSIIVVVLLSSLGYVYTPSYIYLHAS